MPVIYAKDPVVLPLLNRMCLPRQALIDIGIKVGGERANVAEYEPPQVAGFETWRWGTRFFREDEGIRGLDWEACDRDQVSGIKNPKLRIKLVVCATNINTGNPDPNKQPKNLRDRGPASRRLIHQNTGQMKFAAASFSQVNYGNAFKDKPRSTASGDEQERTRRRDQRDAEYNHSV
jgi:hypothetical protein